MHNTEYYKEYGKTNKIELNEYDVKDNSFQSYIKNLNIDNYLNDYEFNKFDFIELDKTFVKNDNRINNIHFSRSIGKYFITLLDPNSQNLHKVQELNNTVNSMHILTETHTI